MMMIRAKLIIIQSIRIQKMDRIPPITKLQIIKTTINKIR